MTASVSFARFVDSAAQYGLPVGFLREVRQSSYTIKFGTSSSVSPWFNTMTLERAELESVAGLSPTAPLGAVVGVLNLYHEATHAWLDLREDRQDVKSLRAHALQYYKDAPLKTGERADDPERLFQEAMASYVGHRASSYWHALATLTRVRGAVTKDLPRQKMQPLVELARGTKSAYGQKMGQRVFGYQDQPGWFNFSSKQVETTKIVANRMKDFCDQSLLENRIPDQFERKKELAVVWSELRTKMPGL